MSFIASILSYLQSIYTVSMYSVGSILGNKSFHWSQIKDGLLLLESALCEVAIDSNQLVRLLSSRSVYLEQ